MWERGRSSDSGLPLPPPSRPGAAGQWRRGGGASPLTAAGPSRTRTGFPHRAPCWRPSLSSDGVRPSRPSLAAGGAVGGSHLRALVRPRSRHRARRLGPRAAEDRARRGVRRPRRAPPASPRAAVARLRAGLALRRLGRGPPGRSSRDGRARRSTSPSTPSASRAASCSGSACRPGALHEVARDRRRRCARRHAPAVG